MSSLLLLFVKFHDDERAGKAIDHLTSHADCYRSIRQRFGEELIARHSQTLLSSAPWEIISASDTVLRVTTPNVTAVRTRDGTYRGTGSVSEKTLERLSSYEIPACGSLSGRKLGVVKTRCEQQLEVLGYR